MVTVNQVLGVHLIPFTEIWLLNISIKKRKKLLAHFTHTESDILMVKEYSEQDANVSQLVEKLIKRFSVVFFMQRKLEIKNNSSNLSAKQA